MGRLVITRRRGERVRIGEDIWVEVVLVNAGKVQLAVSAPKDLRVMREELLPVNSGTTGPAGAGAAVVQDAIPKGDLTRHPAGP